MSRPDTGSHLHARARACDQSPRSVGWAALYPRAGKDVASRCQLPLMTSAPCRLPQTRGAARSADWSSGSCTTLPRTGLPTPCWMTEGVRTFLMITLPHAVSRYLSDFRIAAIFVSSSGVIGVATPRYLSRRSAVACWWCTDRASAEAVLVAIGESTP